MNRFKELEIDLDWFNGRNVSVAFLCLVTLKTSHAIYKYYRVKSKVKAKREECLAACRKMAKHLTQKGVSCI